MSRELGWPTSGDRSLLVKVLVITHLLADFAVMPWESSFSLCTWLLLTTPMASTLSGNMSYPVGRRAMGRAEAVVVGWASLRWFAVEPRTFTLLGKIIFQVLSPLFAVSFGRQLIVSAVY